MADFEKSIPHILKWEGGYVDHPADPGGATNRGITISIFRIYAQPLLGINPTIENLKTITEYQASQIYKVAFWDKMKGDNIQDQQVANIFFDGFVNMGRSGIKLMQSVLNVEQDGIVGPNTLRAINLSTGCVLFGAYKQARINYYKDLAARKPKLAVFLKGWINRINSFEYKMP